MKPKTTTPVVTTIQKRVAATQQWKQLMLLFIFCMVSISAAQPLIGQDLFIRDTQTDDGTEPYPNPPVNLWSSPDMWVLTSPDPNYSTQPFTGTLPWTLPSSTLNEAEYRDPAKFSVPNWVYVKVTNRGNVASTGTERMRLYWSKAAPSLGWSTQWIDYLPKPIDFGGNCTDPNIRILAGEEITKPRDNVAEVSATERARMLHAILAMDNITYVGDNSTKNSWWDKQDEIHEATHVHNNPAFLPWHRELVNRFELLMRAADPTNDMSLNPEDNTSIVKLHYWDWVTDPRTANGVNLFTTGFMGTSNGTVTSPFPTTFSTDGAITRILAAGAPSSIQADNTIVTTGNSAAQQDQWNDFRTNMEDNHDNAHVYIGGTIGQPHSAFQDPFVFLLHSEVDRLFALWQRNVNYLYRLDPTQVYGTETSSITTNCVGFPSAVDISDLLEPWSGNPNNLSCVTATYPWTSIGGEILVKDSKHASVVSPPIYDDAGLVIPVLQPGESVVLQMPWYPPYPNDFACFGAEQPHFCLLSRIESTNELLTETTNIWGNVKDNNGIAWLNISVINDQTGGNLTTGGGSNGLIIRNLFQIVTKSRLEFKVPQEELNEPFLKNGAVTVNLSKTLYDKWVQGGKKGTNIQEGKFTHMSPTGVMHNHSPNSPNNAGALKPFQFQITGANATLENIELSPEEQNAIGMQFNYHAQTDGETKNEFKYDVMQFGAPNDKNQINGGVTYQIRRPNCQLPDAGANVTIGRACTTTLTASPIVDGATYTWFDNSTGAFVSSGSSIEVSPTKTTTTYELMMSSPNGCIDFDVVAVNMDLNDNTIACGPNPLPPGCFSEVEIFPNPADVNELHVKFKADEQTMVSISFTDMQGRVWVKDNVRVEPGSIERILPIDKVPPGVYKAIIQCKEKLHVEMVTRM